MRFRLLLVATGISIRLVAQAEDAKVYDSAADLTASLAKTSQSAITRDNEVSLFLTELQIAPVESTQDAVRFALVVDVELISDARDQSETFSYVFDQPIQNDAATGVAALASAFRTIFSNRSLKNFREIHLQLNLIRLDAAERESFARVASLFGSVVNKSMFQPLLTVLGISSSQATAPKVLAFDGRFIVPANYWAHQDAVRSALPALTNDEPIVIAYTLKSPIGNTNVVAFLKNATNKAFQLVKGKTVLQNFDQVQGFATFVFTKNQFSPVPVSLNDSLMQLKAAAEQTELPSNFEARDVNNSMFLYDNLKKDMPSVGRESVITFVELARLYRDYRVIREAEAPTDSERKAVIQKFAAWIDQSGGRLHQEARFSPPVKGIYSATADTPRYPTIMYPYGLADDLILSAVQWQLKIHEFVAESASTSEVTLKRLTFSMPAAK